MITQKLLLTFSFLSHFTPTHAQKNNTSAMLTALGESVLIAAGTLATLIGYKNNRFYTQELKNRPQQKKSNLMINKYPNRY